MRHASFSPAQGRPDRWLHRLLPLWLILAVLVLVPVHAQSPPAASPAPAAGVPAGSAAPAAAAAPAPAAIPVPDVAVRAENALADIRQLEERIRGKDIDETAASSIAQLERETAFRLREVRQLKNMNVSLETVQGLEEALRDIETRNGPVLRALTQAALQVDRDLKELDRLEETWNVTIAAAAGAEAPPAVVTRAREVVRAIAQAKKGVLDDREKVLALQGRATDIGTRIGEARVPLAAAAERAVTRLLYRDSPPLWSGEFWVSPIANFSDEARDSLQNQANTLADYLRTQQDGFILHLMFFVAVMAMFIAVRNRMDAAPISEDGPGSRQIFDMPMVSALLLALLCSSWFYPRPPRTLWLLIGVLVAGPLLVFARRVVETRIYPLLLALVAFYLADRLRALFAPLPGVHRVLLLLEVLSLILFFLTWLRHHRGAPQEVAPEQRLAWRLSLFGIRGALLLALVVLGAAAGGYTRFADLLMRALLASGYTAVVLYALTREGLVKGLLHVPPISFLAGVRRHRATIAPRLNTWLKRFAFLLWLLLSLQAPGFLPQLMAFLASAWNASWQIGTLNISVREICLFFLILWTTWMLSRLTRFLLEEEIFSRVRLDRGLPYAVSTTVHYIILLSGFVLALTAVGVDMTKFTIVAGALTVGVGFGLQNIVNNFVSGLIVLFERPVKVGDTIQIGDMVGRVQHIGIRATIVHSTSGAEVIIPNGKLIADQLTNWTLSSQLRQLAVPVITKPDVSVAQLKGLLLDIAGGNRQVLETPAPEVLFLKRGVDLFEFELRVWTGDLDAWLQVRSDLITAINDALSSSALAAAAALPQAPPEQAGPTAQPGPPPNG
ncbi:MAG TPA: mechanosensitive ion channel domain-containing protein [Noviherbaspirillum sp.]|jgi:small-conductance mechanosensitive channel|uniref:mechanosensitive ion channel family protein n=1 Tax=Noviherbaspirillum sp. TaxID=1926288 RepID=UPI002F93329E